MMPDPRASHSSFKDQPLHTSSKLSTKDRNGQASDPNSSSPGKKLSAEGALLKDKHPELFFIEPRPGRFVRNLTPPHQDPSKTDVKDTSVNKSKKPTVVGPTATSVSINDVLATQISCSPLNRLSKEEERNNTVRMCSIAISTVIMLARHTYKDITLEHVKHTETYFRALRQENGYPQNIGQLMQVLANLKRSGTIVTPPPDEEDSDNEDEDIQISDIIN